MLGEGLLKLNDKVFGELKNYSMFIHAVQARKQKRNVVFFIGRMFLLILACHGSS